MSGHKMICAQRSWSAALIVSLVLWGAGAQAQDVTDQQVIKLSFEDNYVDSNGTYTGTLLGGNASFVDGPTGHGRALRFTNADTYLSFVGTENAGLPSGNAARTIAFRAKTGTSTNDCTVVNWGYTIGQGAMSRALFFNPRNFGFSAWLPDVPSTYTATANVWNHYAITYYDTNNTMIFYVDGAQVGPHQVLTSLNTRDSTGVTPSYMQLTVGGDANRCTDLSVDDVRIYSKALSAAEVQALSAFPGSSIPTLSQWGMMGLFALLAGTMAISMRRRRSIG